jgi:kumamolisin
MNRLFKRPLAAILAIGLLAALSVWLIDVGFNALRPNNDVSLTGNTPSVLYKARYLSHVDPNEPVRVVVGLKLRDQAGLDALLKAQRDPSSPDYRHFLTPDQFRAKFGPTAADIATAKSYFTSRGLAVDEAASSNAVIVLKGTSGQFESAFKVRLNTYAIQGVAGIADGNYMSNDQDPTVPSSLTNIVESISGLSDFAQYHSRAVRNGAAPKSTTPHGYSPQDIASAYNFPTANNANATVKYTGKGYTVAIATAYGYKQSDVDAYWKQWNITRTGTVTNVAVNGQTTQTDDETTLDLETVGAQAPGANIIMYIGADPAYRTFTMIFNQIVNENKADVVSVSWGSCEANEGWAQMRTESAIFKQAAAQGIAVFSSSGDDGAYDCGGKSLTFAVDYPSADPNVTAVGGTSLHLKDGKRTAEEAWKGAGGGESNNFGRPEWQVGNGVTTHGWFGWFDKRLSADVAMDADPYTGYAIYVDGGWIQIGGTSVSTPDWAAVWILATEANGGRLGHAAPTVWRLANTPDYPKVFVDITKGNNGAGKGPGFNAGPGFDHPTGWGVPDVTALVNWLHDDFHKNAGH